MITVHIYTHHLKLSVNRKQKKKLQRYIGIIGLFLVQEALNHLAAKMWS